VAAIDASPDAARTVVVVTTDHGELFHEHGISRHGRELWENLMHVPWMMRVPGIAPRRVHERRSHIDLVPTLLELMRVTPADASVLHGVSLAGDLVGSPDPERTIFMDLPWGPANAPRRGIIVGDWKLIVRSGERRELYRLSDDVEELHNLAATQPAELQRMEQELTRITQGFTGPWRRSDIPGIDDPAAAPGAPAVAPTAPTP
jgi:arylsulfatase A-like enzyme